MYNFAFSRLLNIFFVGILIILINITSFAQTGSFTLLFHTAPHNNQGVMLLLTDGTVIVKTDFGGTDGFGNTWDRLTPVNGSYINGVWSTIAPMADTRNYFSSQVLPDGRVYVCGGEYGTGGFKGEIYNPVTDSWTTAGGSSFIFPYSIADANSELLPDGRILQACVDAPGMNKNYYWNPSTNTFSPAPSCLRWDNEATWVKLPDSSILFIDNYDTTSERYIPQTDTWVNDAITPLCLFDHFGYESGAGFLLPDGRVFFIGSTPHTLYYTPSGNSTPGTWALGPDLPDSMGAPDAAAAMLPNGKILMALSHTPSFTDHFPSQTKFYEFDYSTNSFALLTAPGTTGDSLPVSSYYSNMLNLPDGSILFCNQADSQYYEYIPGTGPVTIGAPVISSISRINCDTFQITGTLFNGISEGSSYGDDWQMATNYPIVRLTSGGNTFYATTYNWNRLGAVMTGSSPDTAIFKLPVGFPAGMYSVTIVANGNPSGSYEINTDVVFSSSAVTICAGDSITLSASLAGGTWVCVDSTIASVNSFTGLVHGITSGTTAISYSSGTCTAVLPVTVSPLVTGEITGTLDICQGKITTLHDTSLGGTWSVSNTSVVTIDSPGIVAGVGVGTSTVYYTPLTGCSSIAVISVNPTPVAAITSSGVNTFCMGGSDVIHASTGAGFSYQWFDSGSVISGAISDSISVSSGGLFSTLITNGFGCTDTSNFISITVLPLAVAGTITGVSSLCVNTTTTFSETVTGGKWSSDNTFKAIIDSVTGVLTGVSQGTVVVSYSVTNSCNTAVTTISITINSVPFVSSIVGDSVVCSGNATTFTNATTGGTWSSQNSTIASVNSTGNVVGFVAGATTISYNVNNGFCTNSVTKNITVYSSPAAISGGSIVCVGSTLTLTDSTPGGTWNTTGSYASVTTGGIVAGLMNGSSLISYTIAHGCFVSKPVSVNLVPVPGVIIGGDSICQGSSITLSNIVSGGFYTASNVHAAVLEYSGVVTGITQGVDTITYTVLNSCGTGKVSKTIAVNPSAVAGVITGVNTLCVGDFIPVFDTASGGIWSCTNTQASIDAFGNVTGLAAGIDTIQYTVTNGCGPTRASLAITVNTIPNAGYIVGPSLVCGIGGSLTLSDASTGGSWTTANGNVTISGGVVTGASYGTDVVTYTVSNMCATLYAVHPLSVAPLPYSGTISGLNELCANSVPSITLTDTTVGGLWSCSGTHASIDGAGVVTGISVGNTLIYYAVTNICGTSVTTFPITINPLPNGGVISGPDSLCVGAAITLSETETSGTWSISSSNVSLIGLGATCILTGINAGIDTLKFTVVSSFGCGTAIVSQPVYVNLMPSAGVIYGPDSVCILGSISLTDSIFGGTWSVTNNNGIVNDAGLFTGIFAGKDTVVYLSNSLHCGSTFTSKVITIKALPFAGTITGPDTFCVGTSVTLTDSVNGGNWNSAYSFVGITPVYFGSIVSGTTSGIDTIWYRYTNSCGTDKATKVVIIKPIPHVSSILGIDSVCVGSTIILTDSIAGGNWISNIHASLLTVPGGVNVKGMSEGIDTVIYKFTNGCGTDSTGHIVNIIALPIGGIIVGLDSICKGWTTTLLDPTANGWGYWSASNFNASIDSSGVVQTLSVGLDTFFYYTHSYCGNASAHFVGYINDIIHPTVSGISFVCIGGGLDTLYGSPSGGVWSSADTLFATVTNDGYVAAIAPKSEGVVIKYSIANTCGVGIDSELISVFDAAHCNNEVPEQHITGGLNVYPNPARNEVIVEFSDNSIINTVTIFDVVGNEVFVERIVADKVRSTKMRIDVPSGIYFIKVLSGENEFWQKLVVWK